METKNKTKNKKQQQQGKPAVEQEKSNSTAKGGARVSDMFKETIKAYLDKRAAEDKLFAKAYDKENKSLDQCCNFILQQVRKSGRCGFADEEIYGMAVHYYDEDDIKDVKPVTVGKIVVNHVVELSEEEKAKARENARAAFEKEQLEKLRENERKRAENERKRKKEERKRQKSLQLLLFDM